MTELIEDLKIYQQFPDEERLQLSQGTILAMHTGQPNYRPTALLPKLPWALAHEDAKDLLALHTPEHFQFGKSIAIVRLPDDLVRPFTALELQSAPFDPPNGSIPLASEHQHLLQAIYEYATHTYCFSPAKLTLGPVVAGLPNELTATFHRASGMYTGLHIDSWEHDSLPARAFSPNRISINIGTGTRYFLCLNVTSQRLAQILYPDGNFPLATNELARVSSLGPEFMKNYPNYPIVAIAVRPGEAYIAPTENIFHDGSTAGSDVTDLTITLRGYFSLRQEQLATDEQETSPSGEAR